MKIASPHPKVSASVLELVTPFIGINSKVKAESRVSKHFAFMSNSDDAPLFDAYGRAYYDLFQRTGDLADIFKAKLFWQAATHLTPEGNADLPGRLSDLGVALRYCFEHAGDFSDISEAISCQRKAILLTPDGHEELPGRLNNLGNSLMRSFEHTGDLSDISEAISTQQAAVHLTPDGHSNLPSWLNNLGVSLSHRFERTGNLSDISEAISCQQRAVNLTPEGHPSFPDRLNDLGNSLESRFERTGDLSDISEAITYQQKAIDLTPEGHTSLPTLLNALGNSLTSRFERTGNLDDVSQAISFQKTAVRLTPEGHADLPLWLNNLGISLKLRFARTGELDDISAAISSQQRAVDLTPEGHASLPRRLGNLGTSLSRRFDRTGDLDDIYRAISSQRRAVQLTPEGHVILPAQLLNLGISLTRRFEHKGDVSDISEAISCQQKAVHLTPEGHANLPQGLNGLGLSLMYRFKHTQDLNDISEAISSQRRAVLLTPEGHTDLPTRLHNLGNSLTNRFELTGTLSDISQAISSLQEAVRLTPESHANLPLWLNTLGVTFMRRFEDTNDLGDISEAISAQQRAVRLTPKGHANLPTWLNNLGIVLMHRFTATGDLNDISEAILFQEKAVNLIPEGHFNLPSQLRNLGEFLTRRFERTGDSADVQSAMTTYRLSATSHSGFLASQLSSARKWASLSKEFDPSHSLDAWRTVIDLSSHVAGLGHTIQKRYEFLLNTSEISASAAAAAFAHGRPDMALEWLEQGRCLVWSQLNNLRTPLDALRAHDQALAKEVLIVSRALESAGARSEPAAFTEETTLIQKMSLQDEVHTHMKLAQQWEQLLTQVRAIPGFENFIRPIPCPALMQHLPKSGAVIVINVHQNRSDALILKSGLEQPQHVPLPDFSYKEAENLRRALSDHLHYLGLWTRGMRPERNLKTNSMIKEVLRQLWNFVVKPILDTLGFTEAAPDMPRIWWCATGPLAFLPIHAAGIYAESGTVTLSDFAISSYIPTVSALAERLKNPGEIDIKKRGLVIASQPNTPGLRPLPGTTEEVQAVEQLLRAHKIQQLSLEGSAATVAEGLKQMQAHSCIHFACHAQQNTKEPLESGFYLDDGRLSLSSIIKQRLEEADLAFLAACQTSTGDEKLSEEAVHLAAGMLAAGYRGVVATMWSISDSVAPKIAERFYSKLIADSEVNSDGKMARLSGEGAACALHYATKETQMALGDTDNSLLAWVPYVHFGL